VKGEGEVGVGEEQADWAPAAGPGECWRVYVPRVTVTLVSRMRKLCGTPAQASESAGDLKKESDETVVAVRTETKGRE
jgi:hypothetical protein